MAVTQFKITGVEKVMANLNKEVAKIKGASMKGLVLSVSMIRRSMDKTPPLIPVDLGNLRASFFSVTGFGKATNKSPGFKGDDAAQMGSDHSSVVSKSAAKVTGRTLVIFGFSANYAAAVEENNSPKHWNRKGSGRAFMQSAISRNKSMILQIIAREAKVR